MKVQSGLIIQPYSPRGASGTRMGKSSGALSCMSSVMWIGGHLHGDMACYIESRTTRKSGMAWAMSDK